MAAWRYEISLLLLTHIFQDSKRTFVTLHGNVIPTIYFFLSVQQREKSSEGHVGVWPCKYRV